MSLLSDLPLRASQERILAYTGGLMGISAVPGSGKTWTLSLLAARIIELGWLNDDQEILIVTLVNSAVENFYQRVNQFVQKGELLPNIGYRVRTLHGLAHDIVRERPELAGLDSNFVIVDEREADSILDDIVQAWIRSHPDALDDYLQQELEQHRLEEIHRHDLPNLLRSIAQNTIRYVKDQSWTPEMLSERVEQLPVPLPLAELCAAFYTDYQRSLAYRGAVDFDDLIRLALSILKQDLQLRERLQYRWPYILEDEAQDSSELQEEILKLLSGENGNWVRVGDPNQAIYETFTTANPKFLRNFISRSDVVSRDLQNSGRSSKSIIQLANFLVEWTMLEHPLPQVRDALMAPPCIHPVSQDDPQPNPPDDPSQIYLVMNKYSPAREILAVADSLARWLPDNPDKTVAVLAPRNQRAFDLVDELKRRNIDYSDALLRSSSSTRFSASILGEILQYLSDPSSAGTLAKVFINWQRGIDEDNDNDDEAKLRTQNISELLRKCRQVEDFIWPGIEQDWLENTGLQEQDQTAYDQLTSFRALIQRWQSSVLLPIDQIILTISQDLLTKPQELALAHKFAVLLRQANHAHPAWRLPQMAEELMVIARNERRFIGFSNEDSGFNPEMYKGKVIVSTIHKAKGMEWDRVYLMSVNNYDFPSGLAQDTFISEKWFVRNGLNLEAEAIAQLNQLIYSDNQSWYDPGTATLESRLEYIKERMRLLYVGITRARSELILTWNTGRGKLEQQPAVPLIALSNFWALGNERKLRLCADEAEL